MTRRLLLISYWFPPNNAIGASRAAAIACFFRDQGWKVTIIAADSASVSRDFSVNLDDIEIYRVTDTWLTKLLNFRTGRKLWVRAISALLRYAAFPDAFKTTVRKMWRVADELNAHGGKFDVIISTALPFSQHQIAARIAQNTGAMLVLDNRDTWACSTYRRRLPLSEGFERRFEHQVLSTGDLVTTISDGMSEYYRRCYPDFAERIITVRNGVDSALITDFDSAMTQGQMLHIVYTGILYGKKRDIRPALEAARQAGLPIVFDFYGSEPDQVAVFKQEYPELEIVDHGRVARHKAIAAQRRAHALLVGLGTDEAEKTFLPGKFFEYLGTGRPIIVIADQDYEISRLVVDYGLGIAIRDAAKVAQFLLKLASGAVPLRKNVAESLTRDYQLKRLEQQIIMRLGDSGVKDHSETVL